MLIDKLNKNYIVPVSMRIRWQVIGEFNKKWYWFPRESDNMPIREFKKKWCQLPREPMARL